MIEVGGVPARLYLPGRRPGDEPIAAADLVLRGTVSDGRIALSGTLTARPYRLAVGSRVIVDFATAPVRRAGVLRCTEAVVASYDHPRISLTGKGIGPSPIHSLTR